MQYTLIKMALPNRYVLEFEGVWAGTILLRFAIGQYYWEAIAHTGQTAINRYLTTSRQEAIYRILETCKSKQEAVRHST